MYTRKLFTMSSDVCARARTRWLLQPLYINLRLMRFNDSRAKTRQTDVSFIVHMILYMCACAHRFRTNNSQYDKKSVTRIWVMHGRSLRFNYFFSFSFFLFIGFCIFAGLRSFVRTFNV